MKNYYVYILFNKKHGTLYTGITSDLIRRVWEHKNKVAESFTKKYDVDKLGYYEVFNDVEMAILREKQIKNWHRSWKIDLIENNNKSWNDLYKEITK